MRVFSMPFALRLGPVGAGVRVGFALAAAAFAYQGFVRFDESRQNFDEAALWLALSLVCLALVSWGWRLPRPASAWRNALTLVREHWLELALLSAIVGFGVLVRLYFFREYLPSGVIFGEEGVQGRIAYEILHGDRPLQFPVWRYSSALGFLLFGENTTGLRVPFVLAGILTIVLFYLLARELVRPPAALFATSLLAASRLMVDPFFEMQADMLAVLLLFFLFVRGIRTGSPLLLLGAGFLTGLLSYEWGPFKAAPLVVVGFAGALAIKGLVWPLPKTPSVLLHRSSRMIRNNWRLALAFFGTAVIVAIPLLVAELRGEGIYLEDVERHRTGAFSLAPGLIADDWLTNLKWAAQLFLPFGPRTFPESPITSGVALVDVVTGTLLALGVVLAVITFYKPYRALFLGYFLIGMAALALLGDPFRAIRFIPFLPVGLILVAFLVDDISATVRRLAPRAAVYALPVLMVGAVVLASVSNVQTLFGTIVDDPELPRVYSGHRPERGYALCDYLRQRGQDNFSYIRWDDLLARGFSKPTDTVAEQLEVFGDLAWVCGGLRGVTVAAPQEAWPLRPASEGPVTFAFITSPAEVDRVAAVIRQALPNKPWPDHVFETRSANGRFALVGYEFSADDVRALQGLHGRYEGADGRLLEERVDDVASLRWEDDDSPAPPFTVRWQGVVYLDAGEPGGQLLVSLAAVSDDPVEVRVDGRVSFSSLDGAPGSFPQELLPGWHPLEVTVVKRELGGAFSLHWMDGQGQIIRAVESEDLFPMRSLNGWRHRRTLESEGELVVSERFDFEPYLASYRGAVVREEWSAVWRVKDEGEFRLEARVQSGALLIKLDGETVLEFPSKRVRDRTDEVALRVRPGEHQIEVIQIHDGGHRMGAQLRISDPQDSAFMPDLSPF